MLLGGLPQLLIDVERPEHGWHHFMCETLKCVRVKKIKLAEQKQTNKLTQGVYALFLFLMMYVVGLAAQVPALTSTE